MIFWSALNLAGHMPSCHHAFVGSLWVPNFFLWVFGGSRIFSRGYFVGLQFFSRRYFMGPQFFVGILWVQNFLLWAISYFLVFAT